MGDARSEAQGLPGAGGTAWVLLTARNLPVLIPSSCSPESVPALPFIPSFSGDMARLETLRQYGILDSAPEVAFDNLVRLTARFCEVPMAAIAFVDRDRLWFKAQVGLPQRQVPREGSFL